MKKRYLIFLFSIFFVLMGCQTVSNKVDKTVLEEEKKLSKFLGKTEEELKIEFGEPDLIETIDKDNKHFVYLKSKLKIKCERRFEISPKKIVIGYSSKNCF
tara:strand:+ start:169 stop:471 length:303 start_codon:yes stop_codon:yes gene_type:complete